ncbi:carbohydrate kinase family protein [Pseudomonas sp. Marseille-QA0892]
MYLVCGEALFDVFDVSPADGAANTYQFKAVAGGSPFNVAIGLRRLGCEVQFVGGLSSDSLGTRLRRLLQADGVGTQWLKTTPDPTTLAMVTLDSEGHPQYDFRGTGCADRSLSPSDLPAWDSSIRGVHFGSYSLVVEPIGSSLLAWAERLPRDCLVTLDPNIRLNVEPDVTVWRKRIEAFASYADIIKVSDEDLQLLYPESDPASVVQRWLSGRSSLVVVTRGAEGASAYTASFNRNVSPFKVVVRDTVGAGDTFQAALIAYLDESAQASSSSVTSLSESAIEVMLRFASAASAITCSRTGPDLPYRSEVNTFLAGCP